MRNVATISEHGHYLLGTHTSDVHYREFLRYIAKVSDYWLKLKELKVGDKVSIKDAETFCYDCDKLIHKVGDIKRLFSLQSRSKKTEAKDKLAWLKDLKSKVMESLPDETEEKVIIELEIDAESCGGLDGKRLEQAVEKDLPFTVETRLDIMSGDVGCYNDGKPFGYKYKPTGFTIE